MSRPFELLLCIARMRFFDPKPKAVFRVPGEDGKVIIETPWALKEVKR